jgi:TDG/mug DNA glycosylase family protein
MSAVVGFAPLTTPAARVLVLGSMPGLASLEKHQYYGKPQNAFWKIMGDLFGAGPDLHYEQRTAMLAAVDVAVWDVIASCVRPGSLDSNITMQSVRANDFAAFFVGQPAINHVFFNGRKAEETWRRFVMDDISALRADLDYTTLPSTSPAMASLSYAAKLQQWQVVSAALERGA